MCFDIGPAFGAEQAKQDFALFGWALRDLSSCAICRQPIQKSRPVVLAECICDCSSHAPTIVPRLRTSGFQVAGLTGEFSDAFDLFFFVLDRSKCTTPAKERGGSCAPFVVRVMVWFGGVVGLQLFCSSKAGLQNRR